MPSETRSRLQTDERRAQLLKLGMRLFGTRAYDEISIDDIAAQAGVSKGLLYHYFGGKRDFYVASVQHAAGCLVEALTKALDVDAAGLDKVRPGLVAYLTFVEEHAEAYSALVTGGLGADPEVSLLVEGTRRLVMEKILWDLGLTQMRPVLRMALRNYIGGVEATASEWLTTRHVSRDDLLEFLSRQLRQTLELAISLDPDCEFSLDGASE